MPNDTRQAGILQLTRDQIDCAYRAWRDELAEEDFPDLPMAPVTSHSLFQMLLRSQPD
jgi:hypothetical protein